MGLPCRILRPDEKTRRESVRLKGKNEGHTRTKEYTGNEEIQYGDTRGGRVHCKRHGIPISFVTRKYSEFENK